MNFRYKVIRFLIAISFTLGFISVNLFVPQDTVQADCASGNEIEKENCLPGNPSSQWDVVGAGDDTIQGFATDISVNRNGTIDFKIDTTATTAEIRIYRLGYYNGNGARLVATIPSNMVTETDQPACNLDEANRNLLDCGNWSVSASWQVPDNATSGVYIARPTRTDTGGASHIVFIVRDDASTSDLLFQTSDTTWQSYNPYGGYNAYGSSGATMAEKLSYNRPFTTRGAELENWLFNAEYPMIRWLERNGYDVSYMSAVDTERHADLITNHEVFLSVGHDEYWSQGRRDAVTAARDAGVNLAFFSGNEIYWKTRWEDSATTGGTTYAPGDMRIQVVYKEGSAAPSGAVEHRNCYDKYDCDPSPIWTGLWREAPASTPENSLSGQISWRLNTAPISVPGEYAPLRFWRNTTVAALAPTGEVTLADGTLGYEWDPEYPEYAAFYPAGRFWLSTTNATSFNGPEQHHLSLYRAPSGALVFGAGTVQWSWGLDVNHDREGSTTEDRNIQQATVNLFADMGVQPTTLQSGLTAATASTDTTPPTVAVTLPASGSSVSGGSVTITGTASDSGGVVAGIEISTNGGTTWQRASGRVSWSYTYIANQGTADVRVRAVDDSANLSAAISHTFNVLARVCPCSIWNDTTIPNNTSENDSSPVEIGVRFQSSQAGYITALRFYKGANNTGTHIGHLWSATSEVPLATAQFISETDSGWQQVNLAPPVAIDANTTYIASYFAPNGHYAADSGYFTSAFIDSPLTALADPNGVYSYSSTPGNPVRPTLTYFQTNYWVDVVFATAVGSDTTKPVVQSVSPFVGATEVAIGSPVTATFNEGMDSGTITTVTFILTGPGSTLVEATVSYNSVNRTAVLTPSAPLLFLTQYTATIKGGDTAPTVKDLAGNALAMDYSWSFTTQAVPGNEGPGGPILVISSAANPFSRYYAEILRAEGLNAFLATDITNVNAAYLANYDVVILGEMSLTSTQAAMFSDWVTGTPQVRGGNLIAMRPDPDLASLLGLTSAGTTLSEGYMLVDTASPPGTGIVNQTIQFHGTADRYTLNGATSVATLYSDAATPTTNPAVTMRSVGTRGGQAAAFTYDLARSIVYTRQGNPAWIDTNGDNSIPPVRADDLFHRTGANWVNLDKVAIPQADEQQRLLANMILSMNTDRSPLPRFWYFPRDEKAVVLLTSDDHASSNVPSRLDQYLVADPTGCSVADWTCIRASVYIYSGTQLTPEQAAYYTANGFEIGAHIDTNCANYTPSGLLGFYTSQLAAFTARFPGLPLQASERTHCIAWSGWATQPLVKVSQGIRLDTNYYYWPPDWLADRPGMFTGTGMPMRFADLDGTMIDVYQATTQMTDESGQTYPATIDSLLDRAIGTEGYYGVFTANMHTDNQPSAGADAIVTSAKARGVPVVSGRQLLTWLDGRNASLFTNIAWAGTTNTLTFGITTNSGANGLQALLPVKKETLNLDTLKLNGENHSFTQETIKGIQYARFAATAGTYTATYTGTPTAANLNYFRAWKAAEGVELSWETVSEATTAGFNIYRRELSGEFVKVNDALIPPLAGGQPQGASYTFLDTSMTPDRRYEYRLEIVETSLQSGVSILVTYWPYSVSLPVIGR